MIDRSSPEFMFGQILVRLDALDDTVKEVKDETEKVSETINKLPCTAHSQKITGLEEWRAKQNNTATFHAQATIKFKHALVVGLIIAGFSCGLTFLISFVV